MSQHISHKIVGLMPGCITPVYLYHCCGSTLLILLNSVLEFTRIQFSPLYSTGLFFGRCPKTWGKIFCWKLPKHGSTFKNMGYQFVLVTFLVVFSLTSWVKMYKIVKKTEEKGHFLGRMPQRMGTFVLPKWPLNMVWVLMLQPHTPIQPPPPPPGLDHSSSWW